MRNKVGILSSAGCVVGFCRALWIASVVLVSPLRGSDLETDAADKIVRIRETNAFPLYWSLTTGDYNGDGIGDLWALEGSLFMPISGHVVLSWGDWVSKVVGDAASTTVQSPSLGLQNFFSADIDGDGNDDLAVTVGPSFFDRNSFVEFIYGSARLPSKLFFGTNPDLKIRFGSNNAVSSIVGDVTGDGRSDLVFGYYVGSNSDSNCVYVVPGSGARRMGTLDIVSATDVIKLEGLTINPDRLHVGDFNNDGIQDIVVKGALISRAWEKIYVIFGSPSISARSNLSLHPPDRTIVGLETGADVDLKAFVDDMDGDGSDDFLYMIVMEGMAKVYGIPGADLSGSTPVIDLSSSLSLPKSLIHSPVSNGFSNSNWSVGDFDGDGNGDVAVQTDWDKVRLWLSSDHPPWLTEVSTSPSLSVFCVYGMPNRIILNDLNRDGFDDLIVGEVGSGNSYWANILYGFHPLDNPSIAFRDQSVLGTERTVDVTVEGDPTEMMLDGDADPTIVNRWIPFRRSLRLALVPGRGERTVGVRFRNRFKRESERAEGSTVLAVGDGKTQPVTTILRPGGPSIRVDCHVESPGRVKAWIADRLGRRVNTVADEDRDAGIWPIEWDGKNEAGEAVGPGVYFLHMETPAGEERRSVVVQ